jgi:hypothetical protein
MQTKPKTTPPKILTCAQCGKISDHELVHCEDYTKDVDESQADHPSEDVHWLAILECKSCKKPSVYHDEWDDIQQKWVATLTYPVPIQAPKEVPPKIQKLFNDAILLLGKSTSMTAVGIRKCLEGICDDKQAEGNTLKERISYLSSNGFIPLPLSEMMESNQTIGKIGSHFGNMEISLEEVNVLIDYSLAMFECLYVVQDKLKTVQQSIDKLE